MTFRRQISQLKPMHFSAAVICYMYNHVYCDEYKNKRRFISVNTSKHAPESCSHVFTRVWKSMYPLPQSKQQCTHSKRASVYIILLVVLATQSHCTDTWGWGRMTPSKQQRQEQQLRERLQGGGGEWRVWREKA